MKCKNNFKYRMLFSAITAVVLSSGIYSASVSAAKPTAGGFDFIEPTSSGMGACPGPYEPLSFTLLNRTDFEYERDGVNHGNSIAANIMYVLDDTRAYTGKHINNADSRLDYPVEVEGQKPPYGDSYQNMSGPVVGTQVFNGLALQQSVRSWTDTRTGYLSLVKAYGRQNVNVFTNLQQVGGSKGTYFLDAMDRGSMETILPYRSYKALRIEIVAGSKNVNDPGFFSKVMTWEGRPVRKSNGSLDFTHMITTESALYVGQRNASTYGVNGDYGDHIPIKGLEVGKVVDLRSLDFIETQVHGEGWSRMFEGSTMKFNQVTDVHTGKPIIDCN